MKNDRSAEAVNTHTPLNKSDVVFRTQNNKTKNKAR